MWPSCSLLKLSNTSLDPDLHISQHTTQVASSAEVSLHGCVVTNACMGICVPTINIDRDATGSESDFAEITRLKVMKTDVSGCRICGIIVGRCSQVALVDCEFSRNIDGVAVCGDSQSSVMAFGVKCLHNSRRGISMNSGAQMVMTECQLALNSNGSAHVEGEGTRLVMSGCVCDSEPTYSCGGKVEIHGRESAS